MKDKIEKKIEEIVEYIIRKPENEITRDDYEIIASEVRDIRFREEEKERQEKLEKLLAVGGFAVTTPGEQTMVQTAECA